jgi:hypothetical protein
LSENAALFLSGGIHNTGGLVGLQNSIVARNTLNFTTPWDCDGPVTSVDHSLIGTIAGCTVTLHPTDLIGDPGLGAYTDNGTAGNGHFPLLPSSRAIGAGNAAACPPIDQLGTPRVGQCDIGAIQFFVPATVDIRSEGSAAINPRSQGVIPVAILTTPTLNSTQIDPSTVRFGRTGVEAAAVRFSMEDVNHDGLLDMVLHFKTQDTSIACGDVSAVLTGQTFGKTSILGSTAIVTVGCK